MVGMKFTIGFLAGGTIVAAWLRRWRPSPSPGGRKGTEVAHALVDDRRRRMRISSWAPEGRRA